jgi:hypothetical protein
MRVIGLALFATSMVVLWLCLPPKGHPEKKSFLRGGADILAAVVMLPREADEVIDPDCDREHPRHWLSDDCRRHREHVIYLRGAMGFFPKMLGGFERIDF